MKLEPPLAKSRSWRRSLPLRLRRFLLFVEVLVLGTALVGGGALAYLTWSAKVVGTAPAAKEAALPSLRKLKRLPDIDALAARMQHDRDIYQKVRDAALATYAKFHPGAHPYDDEARAVLRLAAYLDVWDDFYGEGLWQKLREHAHQLDQSGSRDLIWRAYDDVSGYQGRHSSSNAEALRLNHEIIAFAGTGYPALFKFKAYTMTVENLVAAERDAHSQATTATAALPDLAARAAAEYRHLIEDHFSYAFLYAQGRQLLGAAQDDEDALKAVSRGLDQAFDAADRNNPMAGVLDGEFQVDEAWCARGSVGANAVPAVNGQLFAEHLQEAERILIECYEKHPGDAAMIASSMMPVVLGEQQPREQMELWFQRGIKADPDNFGLYMQKRWYLLPRWYGSDQEVQVFGLECATSDNWAAKIPLILAEAVGDAGDRDPLVYGRPEIWYPLEKVYREFLRRFPGSVHYRSLFARSAVQGEHWATAREQFKILGDEWDRDVFPGNEYAEMKALAAER